MRSEIAGRARAMVILVAALGSALHGAAFVAGFSSGPPLRGAICGALATGALTALLFVLVARAPTSTGAVLRAGLGAIVAGGMNAGLSAFLLGLAGDAQAFELFVGIVVIGGVLGLFVGALFGVVLTLPAALLSWATREPSRSTVPWLAAALGTWLAVVAIWQPLLPYSDRAEEALGSLGAYVAGLASVVVVASLAYLAHRASWLARVRRGGVPGFAIVPASTMLPDPELLPWGPSTRPDAILVCERATAEGAYRGVVSREPIAYVSAPELIRG